MKVNITIERDDDDEESTSMGISASGIEPIDVFKMLIAGAEMVFYDGVRNDLQANGATADQAEYGAPLRNRLLAVEVMMSQPLTPYSWVHMDLDEGLS